MRGNLYVYISKKVVREGEPFLLSGAVIREIRSEGSVAVYSAADIDRTNGAH